LSTRGQAAGESFDATSSAALPSARVTRVALLRHGEVESMDQRVLWGQADVRLSPEGERQSAELARWCAESERRPELLFSSDLQRCARLARDLGARLGIEPEFVPALREQQLGAWQGRTWGEITRGELGLVRAYWSDYAHTRPPGGESLADVSARVHAWWDAQRERIEGRAVALVTHVGVIRTFLCQALRHPLEEALRFAPATASHSALILSESGAVLTSFGERPWLAGAPVPARSAAAGAETAAPAPGASALPRIALAGSAGTGKTTLARRLADELGLPYIAEGMRARLEAGLAPLALRPPELRALMREMWQEQRAAEAAAARGFVADRSSIDFAAYWLQYGLYDEVDETEAWLAQMRAEAARYTQLVLLPWGVLPLEDDRVRSTNRWMHRRFQATLESLLLELPQHGVLRVPPTADFDERLAWLKPRVAPAR
jgi:broad specificity phosphatase PhoE/nicotinamide riboside kinase